MNTYIEADKLIAEITRIYNEHPANSTAERYEDGVDDGYCGCCDEIVAVITSLQQEQPHWKPSKEQMEALNAVANEGVLLDLFNDLLKLL